jgi:UDP:flavonoid glycosyltransferase YjiC (YdhE family)
MAGLSLQEQSEFKLKNVFVGVRAERSLPDMLDIIREWQVDVVVRENTEFAGCVAAERAGIPHAVVQITAVNLHWLQLLEAPFNYLCASVDLPPEKPVDRLYRYLLLNPRPLSLWNPSVPIPSTTHPFRYTSFSQSGEEQLPDWVSKLKRPIVYATLGTAFNHMSEIFKAILEALREEPINLILTVGRNRNPIELGTLLDQVHIESYIPHDLLLPHCDAVICHGGSGTMMDALSSGLPMVIVPIAGDQPENGQRCAELGVARVIAPDKRTPEAIREATKAVLQDPRFRQTAQRLQKLIAVLPGLEYPVALLEMLTAKPAPLVSRMSMD